MKLNIEQNHAILAGHTFEHEIALAAALGVFGGIDINRGDYQSGWDTDQFAMNIPEMALAFLEILKAGGFTTGGLNFDAKIRRQSIDPDDHPACPCRLHGCLRPRPADGGQDHRRRQAQGCRRPALRQMEGAAEPGDARRARKRSNSIAARVLSSGLDPQPASGRQERLENLVNSYI